MSAEKKPETDPRLPEMPDTFRALDGTEVLFDAEDGVRLPALAEFGKKLPIGFKDAKGALHRDFDLVPWDFELEEALGDIVEKHPEMPMGQYLSEVVGHSVARVGTIDLTKLKRSEKRLLVYQMFYADVLYMYVHVRIGALGSELKMDSFPCKGCKKPIRDYVGDLDSIEVKGLEGPPRVEVELRRPVDIAGKKRRALVVGGLRWAFMETDDPTILSNPAKMKMQTLNYGVCGAEGLPDGTPVVFDREIMRAMDPRDINRVVAAIDEANGGAVMQIEGRCPKCKAKFVEPIDWSYDDFFGRSSR